MPCITRYSTSWLRLVAAPHSAEVIVNPMTEARKMYLTPNWPASQPVNGIVIAEATMYEVRIQEIWSCEADMLPWMCGRQTLTIVVSSPCMTQAQMIVAVVNPRWGTGAALSPLTACAPAWRAAQLHAYSSARSLSHFIHTAAAP